MIPAEILSTALRETTLGDPQWSEHQLGTEAVVRASWTLSDAAGLDLWKFLRASEPSWAFCWRSREKDHADLFLGHGSVLHWGQDDKAVLAADHGLHLFGGRPFYDEDQSSELWGELKESRWFLPRILVQRKTEGLVLSIHSRRTEAREAMLDEARLWFEAAQAEGGGNEKTESLPTYLRRHDFPEPSTWIASVARAVEAMRNEAFDKVVMSRAIELVFAEKLDWISIVQELLTSSEEAFVFALKTPSGRVFMGRSPERILAWDNDSFALDAIAGTRKRASSRGEDREASRDLQESPKERLEHRLVSETIAQVLQTEGLTFAAVEEEKLLQLQHVQHMRTRFCGPLPKRERGLALLDRLHPTPAVGGVPRAAALAFLRANESYQRGWFAGYIGMLGPACNEFAIGIRSALLCGKSLHLFAGAGIVQASDPRSEWQETELKMRNFLSLFTSSARPSRPQRAETFSL